MIQNELSEFPLLLRFYGDHCKTLAADRQLFLVRDSYISCERKGRWLSPGWEEKACFVDSGFPRPRE